MTDDRAPSGAGPDTQRLDKWLWAARFYKTRRLAADAIAGGKVQVDAQRAKPARLVSPGSRLLIQKGTAQWEVVVSGLCKQRRPAAEAARLYTETEESVARRQRDAERRRREHAERALGPGRPEREQRRRLLRLKRS